MFPIVDIAPVRNRFVIGVDAGSVPERLAAILEARRSHEVTRTRPIRLVQSPEPMRCCCMRRFSMPRTGSSV